MAAQRRSAHHIRAARSVTDSQSSIQAEHADQPLNRRRAFRVLGALAAAAAGAAALSVARPREASADNLGRFDSSTSADALSGSNSDGGVGVFGGSNSFIGVEGSSPGVGVSGNSEGGIGVEGLSIGGGIGVRGLTQSTTHAAIEGENLGSGTGVSGTSDGSGNGVLGTSATGYGVRGQSSGFFAAVGGFNTSNGSGVYGQNTGAGYGVLGNNVGGGTGVLGQSNGSTNTSPGVYGVNTGGGPAIVGQATGSGFGFSAITQTGTGCFGGAGGAGGTGVYAYSALGTALAAQAPGIGAYAGFFSGSVAITGALIVMGAKSAAVRAADGRLRRMYSLESPESWFEDFGTGKLTEGTTTIQLEPGFSGVVKTDRYHVYLTPRGAPKGPLYIDNAGPSGFTVHDAGGESSIDFDYRIVAKRKDIPGARLERVDEPPTLEVPTFPTLPAVLKPVAPPGHGPDR